MFKDVTFRILEGAYKPDEYGQFVELYNEGLKYEDIRNKMRIGQNKLRKLRKEALSNKDIVAKEVGNRVKWSKKIYKEFVELYNNRELTVTQIKKELKLNDYRYRAYRKYAAENRDIQLRKGRGVLE